MKKNIKSVSEIYICPKKAGNKFRSARKFHTPLYLYGVTGIGKTALILNNVNVVITVLQRFLQMRSI